MSEHFQQDIKFLKGVGPKRAELLNQELQIYSFGDLIAYFPYKYIDRSRFYKTTEINSKLTHIQLKGNISNFRQEGGRGRKRLVADFRDEAGMIQLVWFHAAKWIKGSIKEDKTYVVYGKPAIFQGRFNIIHPEIEDHELFDAKLSTSLQALYNTTEKLKNNFINTRVIHKLQNSLLKSSRGKISESLPSYLIKRINLISREEALINIHFPASQDLLNRASFRLKFEELFMIQMHLLRQKLIRKEKSQGFVFSEVGEYLNGFYHQHLKFELTGAQKRVIKEIRHDLGSGKQMNRLLQGDVGSGKTLVALMGMLIALDNKYQACLMAPTEILANQHFNTISKMTSGLDISVYLLTGSTKKAERNIIDEKLQQGELHILIGTHALIEDRVSFRNLGFVVIDEQHRFGVAQRAKLWKKNVRPPHVLVMTATPIPRTLAMTLYGDLDVSVIDELPPGRKAVKTLHFTDSQRNRVFGFMKKEIKKGQQIFVVFPLIQESEKMDYKDLEDGYNGISRAFPPPEYAVSVIHGKMKAKEKEISMSYFVNGKTHIMVATTVIEVGVDVPNATVMVIESAERFGLSQLHQLRGRVGRGGDQSYCILMSKEKLSDEARKRLETMVNTNDGFEISEVDLRLRGPGDMEGTQQSGMALNLKIANLSRDGQILQLARNEAEKILEADPGLTDDSNEVLKKQLSLNFQKKVNWGVIS